jgi:hypothetical protein
MDRDGDLDAAEVEGEGRACRECFGDLNLDFVVDAADLAILLSEGRAARTGRLRRTSELEG